MESKRKGEENGKAKEKMEGGRIKERGKGRERNRGRKKEERGREGGRKIV